MTMVLQTAWLFLLAIPIASVAWTVMEYCRRRYKNGKTLFERKFFYLFTCEYCFSHYVSVLFLFLTDYKLLMNDWRGYIIAGFALVWIANVYMNLFNFLRQNIKKEKREIESMENGKSE